MCIAFIASLAGWPLRNARDARETKVIEYRLEFVVHALITGDRVKGNDDRGEV